MGPSAERQRRHDSPSHGEPIGQTRGQTGDDDAALRRIDGVRDPAQFECQRSGRVEVERGARVSIARLADRAGIDDVAQAVLKRDLE